MGVSHLQLPPVVAPVVAAPLSDSSSKTFLLGGGVFFLDLGCSRLPLPHPEPSLRSFLHGQPAPAEDRGCHRGPDLGPLQDIQPILRASPKNTAACIPRDNAQWTDGTLQRALGRS